MGLLVVRLAAALSLVGVEHMTSGLGDTATLLLRCLALAVAVLLLLGFGTPFAAVGAALLQIAIMILDGHYNSSATVAAALGVGLALLGPGAWSVDAWLFGRKRIV